ncbi:hypothetical protein [Pseudolactococcus yaeyamensis]
MAEKNNGFLNRIISRFARNVSETELALNEQLTNFRVTFERVLDVEEYQYIEKELEPIKERLLNSPHSLDANILEEYYLGTFIHDSQYRDMNFVEYSDNRPQILEEHAEWVEAREQFAEAEEKALADYDEEQERALEHQEYTEIAQIEADMVSQKRADKLSERLPTGWKMFMYGDGSGHFTAPSGAEFARFDNYTKDFKLLNSQERYGFDENPSEFLVDMIVDQELKRISQKHFEFGVVLNDDLKNDDMAEFVNKLLTSSDSTKSQEYLEDKNELVHLLKNKLLKNGYTYEQKEEEMGTSQNYAHIKNSAEWRAQEIKIKEGKDAFQEQNIKDFVNEISEILNGEGLDTDKLDSPFLKNSLEEFQDLARMSLIEQFKDAGHLNMAGKIEKMNDSFINYGFDFPKVAFSESIAEDAENIIYFSDEAGETVFAKVENVSFNPDMAREIGLGMITCHLPKLDKSELKKEDEELEM